MSPLLDRIGAFFLDPSDDRAQPGTAPGQPPAPDRAGALGLAPSAADRTAVRGYAPPVAAPGRATALDLAAVASDSGAVPDGSAATEPAAAATGSVGTREPVAGPLGAGSDSAAATGSVGTREPVAGPPGAGSGSAAATDSVGTREPAAGPLGAVSGSAAAGASSDALGFAVVLGAPAAAVPLAAACAGELRARSRAVAAVLSVWRGGEMPAGATTPAVRRLAAQLATGGLAATACGRVAWIALDAEPAKAAVEVERCRAFAGVPLVLAIAGPRAPAFEPLLAAADLAIAVLPAEADDPLRVLAVATLPTRHALVLPPLPPGPPRWAAMAGLARLRSLKVAPR